VTGHSFQFPDDSAERWAQTRCQRGDHIVTTRVIGHLFLSVMNEPDFPLFSWMVRSGPDAVAAHGYAPNRPNAEALAEQSAAAILSAVPSGGSA
jgi:hypothetical protein